MNFLNFLKNGLAGIGNRFLALIVPSLKVGLTEVVSIATAAVVAEAPKLISGQEKFDSAVKNVVNTVKSQGKVIATATAKVAVQAAYEAVFKVNK